MMACFFLSDDTAAVAAGADDLAQRLQAALDEDALGDRRPEPPSAAAPALALVRNGSRGLLWLEPLLEVQTPQGRLAFGPLDVQGLASLLQAGLLQAARSPELPSALAAHPLALGPTDRIPYLARQQRLTFARCGLGDPLGLSGYALSGGWKGLSRALDIGAPATVAEVIESGLRGRGGAAFPAGVKWRTVAQASAAQKAIVCNADEGDSGTFSDRLLMEGDPYALIEGMAIAAVAVGASRAYVYVRSEYPRAEARLREAIRRAEAAGLIGPALLGRGPAFHLEVRRGAGSYVCGEETALLESLEGKRGIVRAKPPLPAHEGLFGWPTVINNVITLASVPGILAQGAQAYAAQGVGRSRGTLPFQLAGNIARGGLVEVPLGITLRELLFGFGGGTLSGRPIKAVQVGGPLGAYVPEAKWDVPLDYEAYAAMGCTVGHGGIVVHDDTANLADLARYAMEFCALESCGKCTPCRIGSTRGVEVIDRLVQAPLEAKAEQVVLLKSLCHTMELGSLCAMGGMTPFPVRSALEHYPQDFGLPAAGVHA
jgi:formate dehydrogenase iron-sulfur subunit